MEEEQKAILFKISSHFPSPQGVKISYGTAGFRADASILQSTVYRVGILSSLRSLKTQSVIGLMITASHNKVTDNGIKIADPSGEMLTQAWEPFADQLANASDPQLLLQLISEFVTKENIPLDGTWTGEILVGRDTRPSGASLLEAAEQGIGSVVGAVALDMGILTTPQLHWMVRARNKGMRATELDYFKQLSDSFRCLMDLIPNKHKLNETDDKLVVDGANGVGGEKLEILKKMLDSLAIEVRNSGKGEGVLNEGVGADYVQKEKVTQHGFGIEDVGIRCASLDGDGDRLVYFTVPSNSSGDIDLIDGDKILSLFALFIKEQLSILNKEVDKNATNNYEACLGVIQTAYANGASTDYLKQLGLEVVFTQTGVKYLHEKASQYDIGIYFEANGHGTILFSECFLSWLDARNNELSAISKGSEQQKAALRLLAVSNLINQAVGDALSGLLLVEAILKHMGWSVHRWSDLYQDLPSRQLKVKVVDRTAVVTTNAETVVLRPHGLQEAINAETAKYTRGRSFIRPSGTEDVIRVYAEASTQEAADNLANSVAELADQFLGYGSNK
ncbi:PGM_PMM_IV domain-containing protein/PGM_PMM_I domain-containing protein/PGM_PMM_II domain-containing protein/PGM_PMM_III domain-containing protein [Cephalotus follicularis]|uniref:Phosphoacetylglucosamine mutase n=1 Tax=Cephalotus follicularis TaxID=3775 RepID=A0A1Q3DCJ1_CEPFO|nr:PGM_PMM_IV domain-containing protein/PGM_PMM_I domain-containing protein/PGM_PMM_II domain-containing protein/PGM_PMM_III domain-containing protein [Cephalotus follicularis]